MVFQDPAGALNPRQSVYEAVAEGLRIHRVREDEESRVAAALASAGLRPPERFFQLYPHELSGGQRQRVVIAGAMVLEPDVLVADEPVSSLDASVRGEILALLLKLVRETQVTVLVVTHDLGLAWNIADRVAVMYLGRIVEEGAVEEMLVAPKHPYTRALVSVVPETRHMEPQILAGEAPDPTRIPPGCRFHPRCPVLASGESARLGIEDLCRGQDLALLAPRRDRRPVTWPRAAHGPAAARSGYCKSRGITLEAAFHVAGGHVHGDVVGGGIGAEIELASAGHVGLGPPNGARRRARPRSCWVDGRRRRLPRTAPRRARRARRRTRSRGR